MLKKHDTTLSLATKESKSREFCPKGCSKKYFCMCVVVFFCSEYKRSLINFAGAPSFVTFVLDHRGIYHKHAKGWTFALDIRYQVDWWSNK